MELTQEELEYNAKVKGILYYHHSKAMKEAEKIIEVYANDPMIYIQDKTLNNLCHVIMRLWWAVKNNYVNIDRLTENQKWMVYYEMRKKVKEKHMKDYEEKHRNEEATI